MIPFLKIVAEDVYSKFNGKLENVAIVFPNKRAGLFFNRYLLENSGNAPIWSPRYMTISELFRQKSNLTVGDPLLLVSKLYKVYNRAQRNDETLQEYEKSVETLDSFYYWGEMLVRDF
ncbi:MAG: PD-(D/E)XK nuclease family protein, partial [Bacteroidales bacterium]|nr:PD-(D/E)XK nuclease family protein [Bacteroidales bacterium]